MNASMLECILPYESTKPNEVFDDAISLYVEKNFTFNRYIIIYFIKRYLYKITL